MLRWLAGLWLAALLLATPAVAQDYPARPDGPLLDQAGLLTPSQSVDVKSKLLAFNERSGRAIVVATVNSLDGRDIQPYSVELFRQWKIGDAKRDDGVLLLVAPTERKVWITTGYGADDYLTDAMTGTIIRRDILPRFKAGDMGGGIVAGVDAVIAQLELPPEEAARRARDAATEQNERAGEGGAFVPVIVIFVFLFFVLSGLRGMARGGRTYRRSRGGIDPAIVLWGLNELNRGSRRGRDGGWGGGFGGGGDFGGGGFGGFGGGSSGGGGAGGGW